MNYLMGIVTERLSNWAEKYEKINEYQFGFRKNYSMNDNIFSLTSMVDIN